MGCTSDISNKEKQNFKTMNINSKNNQKENKTINKIKTLNNLTNFYDINNLQTIENEPNISKEKNIKLNIIDNNPVLNSNSNNLPIIHEQINNNIKFIYQSLLIESIYIFDDGGFIIFIKEKNSSLYDSKTLNIKLKLDISSSYSFFDLKENEFGLYKNELFTINKFDKNKSNHSEIQKLYLNKFEMGKCLKKLLNGDIVFLKHYMGRMFISIYKYINKIYQFQNNIENCDEILDLNKDEFLAYKKNFFF